MWYAKARAGRWASLSVLLSGLARLGEVRHRRQFGGGDICKILLDEFQRGGLLEVAHDHDHRVVGGVEGVKKCLHILQCRRFEIGQFAIEIVGVMPVLVGVLRHVQPREAAVGLIKDVDAYFVLDDVLLVHQVLLRDGEAAHAIGLGPEHGLKLVRRHDLKIVREVESGGSVEDAAVVLH
jgi:hypothetical protein